MGKFSSPLHWRWHIKTYSWASERCIWTFTKICASQLNPNFSHDAEVLLNSVLLEEYRNVWCCHLPHAPGVSKNREHSRTKARWGRCVIFSSCLWNNFSGMMWQTLVSPAGNQWSRQLDSLHSQPWHNQWISRYSHLPPVPWVLHSVFPRHYGQTLTWRHCSCSTPNL